MRPETSASPAGERVLVVAPTGRDAPLTCRLLRQAGIAAAECRSIDELCRGYEQGAAAMLIAEEALGREAVAQLRELLDLQEAWSDLPIIVFASSGGEEPAHRHQEWILSQLGNVTLLNRPTRPIAMIGATRAALRDRRRQYLAQEAMAERERAVERRDEFLGMLAHELRNPLSAIQMATDVFTEIEDPERQAECVPLIHRQAKHLTRMIDDLLDISRVTLGRIAHQRTEIDLREIVDSSVKSVEAQRMAQRLAFDTHLPRRPVWVWGDSVRLEQVLVNLLANAIKFTDPGGRVSILLSVDDAQQAVLQVTDTGAGIEASMVDRVFELFTQGDRTLARSRGGLGVGLNLVKHLAELHGGEVKAYSAGLGQGSTFTVRLPLHVEEADRDESAARPAAGRATPSCAVLIVEDHPETRELLQQILQIHGHRVRAVGDGRAGVRAALLEPPDTMVVDIGLPGFDGYQVARAIREKLGDSVHLVALTGYGQPQDRQRAAEAGFDAHLTKPVETQTLLAHLSKRDPRSRSPSDTTVGGPRWH